MTTLVASNLPLHIEEEDFRKVFSEDFKGIDVVYVHPRKNAYCPAAMSSCFFLDFPTSSIAAQFLEKYQNTDLFGPPMRLRWKRPSVNHIPGFDLYEFGAIVSGLDGMAYAGEIFDAFFAEFDHAVMGVQMGDQENLGLAIVWFSNKVDRDFSLHASKEIRLGNRLVRVTVEEGYTPILPQHQDFGYQPSLGGNQTSFDIKSSAGYHQSLTEKDLYLSKKAVKFVYTETFLPDTQGRQISPHDLEECEMINEDEKRVETKTIGDFE